ncbi:MAG TPA: hypothetical protein VGI50_04680 [Solirubrobacteraceae bacterium]
MHIERAPIDNKAKRLLPAATNLYAGRRWGHWLTVALVCALALAFSGVAEASGARAATLVPQTSPADQAKLPVDLTGPTITGTLALGGTLTASTGRWSGARPMTFRYQWLRCSGDGSLCEPIRGAIGQTYTVTKADTVTGISGTEIQISVSALGQNSFGFGAWTPVSELRYVKIQGPLPLPANLESALGETLVTVGPAGELPQLLANDGYTASYFVMGAGRITVSWAVSGYVDEPTLNPAALAVGHAFFSHATHQWAHFRVKLTNLGRRMLAHKSKLTVGVGYWYTPFHGHGPGGSSHALVLSANEPAMQG